MPRSMMKAVMPRRPGGGIGLGVDDEGLGEGTVGDPHLRAIEHERSPLRSARVVIDTTSEPAFGSDIASARRARRR
jgi:hypothetical protein